RYQGVDVGGHHGRQDVDRELDRLVSLFGLLVLTGLKVGIHVQILRAQVQLRQDVTSRAAVEAFDPAPTIGQLTDGQGHAARGLRGVVGTARAPDVAMVRRQLRPLDRVSEVCERGEHAVAWEVFGLLAATHRARAVVAVWAGRSPVFRRWPD